MNKDSVGWTVTPPKHWGYYWAFEYFDGLDGEIQEGDVRLVLVSLDLKTAWYGNVSFLISDFTHWKNVDFPTPNWPDEIVKRIRNE
jgi:hypothetical protein